jgi:hypothetical protein
MKITHDYTKNATVAGEVAVMSADLAKKLLKFYANSLSDTTSDKIIFAHMDKMRAITTSNTDFPLLEAAKLSLEFYNERMLIDNICRENWDAYKVEPSVFDEGKVWSPIEDIESRFNGGPVVVARGSKEVIAASNVM